MELIFTSMLNTAGLNIFFVQVLVHASTTYTDGAYSPFQQFRNAHRVSGTTRSLIRLRFHCNESGGRLGGRASISSPNVSGPNAPGRWS